ncbi:MAG: gamma-glutamylcyclotransferase family protein [Planctomycetota bacterium]
MDLFTYGTLQLEEVWQRIAGVAATTMPARAEGYAVYRVAGHDFPGMIAQPGATAAGVVYLGVDTPAIARLDAYEGDSYTRQHVIATGGDGRQRPCAAYIIPPQHAGLLTDEPWTCEGYRAAGGLERFLQRFG